MVRNNPLAIRIAAPRTAIILGLIPQDFDKATWDLMQDKYLVFDLDNQGDRRIMSRNELREYEGSYTAEETSLWFLNDHIIFDPKES